MADPKYANLPGIAHDEPDVYDSTCLPESDQSIDFCEESEGVVERIHISVDDAFNRFKDKGLDSDRVDFSDRISKRIRTGYDARSGDWELLGLQQQGGTNRITAETPLQKFQRLQCEMVELHEDVKRITSEDKENKEETNCLVSRAQVEMGLQKLADLKLEETLGQDVISNIMDPQGAQIKKLLSQLEAFKMSVGEKAESDESTTTEDGITFKLNYRPDKVKLEQTGRVTELEKRLHRLENVLGASNDNLVRLTQATSKKGLLEAAQHLSATASLLDSAQLDHIEGRLTALSQKMDLIAKKKEQFAEDVEKDKMILELYELVKNSENVNKVLPQTVERLKSLEALHSKAGTFATSLAQVEALQAEIKGNVENNKALLKGVQESFAMNLDEINKTVIGLDSRIKAFSKK
ncbi:PREDICTED: dynactin subunit 2 [Nicrophorus vespilloides]|uniref:Dynactin subunit 2 n=1 Tax=Nicrophorus vespilloides TaxID=110193 RepID=A0ABM1N547_NICVS|nr:PREDICTED: dynactin subunit 2 [Nicrophorus vespilloides]XP_017781947.1 PREDICTED: dynactin subunit 2 [Nicrophorus vespilloides]